MPDLYVVIHHHEYGTSTGLVWSDHQPGEDEIVRCMDWNFEPEKEEYITIDLIDEADTKTLPATK
jgi:hypothetical protein